MMYSTKNSQPISAFSNPPRPCSRTTATYGSRRKVVSTLKGRISEKQPTGWYPVSGKLSTLGQAEAGSAAKQPCRGIAQWAYRHDENGACGYSFAPRLPVHRTIDPHALENRGGLGAGPQIQRSFPSLFPSFLEARFDGFYKLKEESPRLQPGA